MSKFLSGRERELKVGIVSYSENKTVLEVVGNSNLTGSINVTGVSTFQNNVHLLDNDKLKLGTGGDLEIYHDGSHSYIDDAGTGNIRVRSGTVEITNLAGSKKSATFNSASGQELYYNNSLKFETTSVGATVYGTTETQQLNVTGVSTFQDQIQIPDNTKIMLGADNDMQVVHIPGTGNSLQGAQPLYLQSNSQVIVKDYGSSEVFAKFIKNGAVELYHDNSKKFETTGYGVTVAGIVSATSFYGDGSNLTNISVAGAAGTVAISTTPPTSPDAGSLWFNPNTARTFVYYDESIVGVGTSAAWVDASPSNANSGSGSGGSTVSIGETAPSGPSSGDLWYSTDYGRLFVWFDEPTLGIGSTSVWIDAAPTNSSGSSSGGSSTVSIGATAPSDASSGDLWYSTDYGRLFVWYDEPTLGIGSTSVWVDAAPYHAPEEEEEVNLGPGKAEKTATATQGQQTFTIAGGYTAGNIDVYLNGIRLNPSEFIASNGSTVVLATAANEGDVFDLVEYTMGIGNTGPAGPAAALSIGTRSGVITQNISGIAFTVSLRSGIGTVNI